MGWTVPKTWASGEVLTAANMNTHVRDNLAALYDGATGSAPPFLQVQDGVAQAWTSGTQGHVNFGTVIEDNAGTWVGTGSNRYVAPIDGIYDVHIALIAPQAQNVAFRGYIGWGVTATTNVSNKLLEYNPALVMATDVGIFSYGMHIRVAASEVISALATIDVSTTLSIGQSMSITWLHP